MQSVIQRVGHERIEISWRVITIIIPWFSADNKGNQGEI
jgi:hypothetical protein